MLSKEDFEFVGTLGRAHGIQGEVSAKLSVDLSGLWEGADTSLFLMLEEQGLLIPYRVLKLRTKGDEIVPSGSIETTSPTKRLRSSSSYSTMWAMSSMTLRPTPL